MQKLGHMDGYRGVLEGTLIDHACGKLLLRPVSPFVSRFAAALFVLV